jgi:PmbA protein
MATSISFLPVAENRPIFEDLVTQALQHAKSLGASDAAAEVSEAQGLAVSVRKGQVETVEQTRDRSMDITVFAGQRRGSASTSDFSPAAMRQTVEAAWHIARYTAEDPSAGLPEASLLATDVKHNLQLHHPWAVSVAQATELAIVAERAALDTDKRITNTEGAGVDTHEGHFVLGNTRGFLDGYAYSRHGLSVAPIAGRGQSM